MQDPGSQPKNTRICPRCKRPVAPGFKFCETCGTRIPVLSTCSKCGTQFITPVKYCDLCGAPVILAVPEPDHVMVQGEDAEPPGSATDELPEDSTGEVAVPAGVKMPGRKNRKAPDKEALPAPDGEDDDVAAIVESSLPSRPRSPEKHDAGKERTPRRYTNEIQEPDTEELLETYGKEYDASETLESSRKPKSRSPLNREAKKPGAVRTPQGQDSPEVFDDALLLSPEKTGALAKPRLHKTEIIGGCIVLITIIAAVYFIGLPILMGSGSADPFSNPPVAETTPVPVPVINRTIVPTPTVTPTPASKALVPQTTVTVPSGQKLYFHVQKSPITAKILITFTGSAGHGSIESADIKVTQPDGSVSTGMIQPLKGINEVILQGSKEADRVEIIAVMSDGGSYRVYDQLVPLET
jgi:hypothetical protein